MEYKLNRTDRFSEWVLGLRDNNTKHIVFRRLERVQHGNFGDHKSVGEGVSELRFANGLRIYYTIRQRTIVLLLVGGNKSSQKADIAAAKQLVKDE